MGNAISLKWQTYHRHMVNTGDWQLFSILHGRQDGLGHVWGQPVAFQGPKTKWNWSEIDEFLSILPNGIEWEKSMYNIISLCTSVNLVCHVCDQLILLNRCIDYDILMWPAMTMTLIKSPQSGVTLCFQFVSSAATSAAATTFASHVKTVSAKPYIFGTKNLWVWGNVLNDLSMTLTQGHGCGIDDKKFACLRDKVRTTHRITTKHGSIIALVMVITWLDFGEKFCWKLLFWQIFFKKFGCVFSRSNTILAVSQEWLVRLMWNKKEMHQLDTGYNMWPWPLTSLMTLTLDVSRSNFDIALSQELLVWLMWNENEVSWYDTGLIVWLSPLTTPMTLTLELKFQGQSLKYLYLRNGTANWHETKRMWVIHSWPWYWLVWPWWGGQMYRIVTGVTSDVGVPSTYLVYQDLSQIHDLIYDWSSVWYQAITRTNANL